MDGARAAAAPWCRAAPRWDKALERPAERPGRPSLAGWRPLLKDSSFAPSVAMPFAPSSDEFERFNIVCS